MQMRSFSNKTLIPTFAPCTASSRYRAACPITAQASLCALIGQSAGIFSSIRSITADTSPGGLNGDEQTSQRHRKNSMTQQRPRSTDGGCQPPSILPPPPSGISVNARPPGASRQKTRPRSLGGASNAAAATLNADSVSV